MSNITQQDYEMIERGDGFVIQLCDYIGLICMVKKIDKVLKMAFPGQDGPDRWESFFDIAVSEDSSDEKEPLEPEKCKHCQNDDDPLPW